MKKSSKHPVSEAGRRAAERLAAEREAMAAARPGRRTGKVEVEIFVGGARITLLDRRASAPPVYAIRRLTTAQRSALIVYGAVLEELDAPGGASELGVLVSGGAGSGGAVDRRLRMIQLRDIAWAAIGDGVALSPVYRGKAAVGDADLGAAHQARPASGRAATVRRPIPRRGLADLVSRDGASICVALRAYGWTPHGAAHAAAVEALVEIGQDVADAWNGLERLIAGETSGFEEIRRFGS